MNKSSKVAYSFLFCLILFVCGSPGLVLANQGIKATLYGKSISAQHSPVMKNDTVLVPFKEIFGTLGFTVDYDSANKTINGTKSGTSIKLILNQTNAFINNIPSKIQVAPQIINGVTYVPLRFIGEASGLEVKWYASSQTVNMYSKELLYRASNGSKFGYINEQGKVAIDYQTKFSDAYSFKDGLAIVYSGGKFSGFINQKGEMVIPKGNYYDAKDFSEGLSIYRTYTVSASGAGISKYGYMDTTGTSVITPQFKKANPFSDGLAAVQVGSKYGYIDSSGKIVIQAKYESAEDFNGGLALVKFDGVYKFIDSKGKTIINTDFTEVDSFSENLAIVKKGTKFGYLDKKGLLSIPAIYDEANPFSEGLASVKINGKKGFIDNKGKMVISNIFDAASDFHDGLVVVETGGKTGFINKTGAWVIQPTLSWAEPFSNGLSYAYSDEGEVYMNKSGQIVWRKNQP